MPSYRLACPFSVGRLTTKGHVCHDGFVNMDKLRAHLRGFHLCNCAHPPACTRPRHVPIELLERMLSISFDSHISKVDRWVKMYMEAFPTHRNVPGPCVPRFSHTLSFVQHPGAEFKNAMIRRLVRRERLSVEEANGELKVFLKRLPIFYDVLSQPEVWGRDESGDEVDEPSTAQPVEVAELLIPKETDISTQQDDGTADETSDTQAGQETPPSSPTTS
ncbi:hypothetical protein NCS52_00273200 [Fusarium sp. LHS14.1]|nr:hypothetical protein NCS52_00273200 [Fusarium sp. LHS14.1]